MSWATGGRFPLELALSHANFPVRPDRNEQMPKRRPLLALVCPGPELTSQTKLLISATGRLPLELTRACKCPLSLPKQKAQLGPELRTSAENRKRTHQTRNSGRRTACCALWATTRDTQSNSGPAKKRQSDKCRETNWRAVGELFGAPFGFWLA